MRIREWHLLVLALDIAVGAWSLSLGALMWFGREPDEDGLGGFPTVAWMLPLVVGAVALALAFITLTWWLVRRMREDLQPITLDSGW